MRRSRHSSTVLAAALALACGRQAEPQAAAETTLDKTQPATEQSRDEPRGPTVGAPAPALALTSLAGERVQLPKIGERAGVIIFGSFS